MSYAMFCKTHGPQERAPCPECGSWHSDPEDAAPDSEAARKLDAAAREVAPKVIDLMAELKRALERGRKP